MIDIFKYPNLVDDIESLRWELANAKKVTEGMIVDLVAGNTTESGDVVEISESAASTLSSICGVRVEKHFCFCKGQSVKTERAFYPFGILALNDHYYVFRTLGLEFDLDELNDTICMAKELKRRQEEGV